jgi:hypothetical protein
MHKLKFVSVFVLLALFILAGTPGVALGQGPDDDE